MVSHTSLMVPNRPATHTSGSLGINQVWGSVRSRDGVHPLEIAPSRPCPGPFWGSKLGICVKGLIGACPAKEP